MVRSYKNKLHFCFLTGLLILVFAGCRKDDDTGPYYGNAYRPAPAGFTVKSFASSFASTGEVTFNSSVKVNFFARFSDSVSWNLKIVGEQSGAIKEFAGLSDTINEKYASWDGGAENNLFFKKGENVLATITFLGSDTIRQEKILIKGAKKYNEQKIKGVRYNIIDDFDGGQTKPDILFGNPYPDLNDINTVFGTTTAIKSNGDYSLRMSGTDKNKNSYHGGAGTATLYGYRDIVKNKHADSVYVNLYIYGTGTENTSLQVRVYEIDVDSIYSKSALLPTDYKESANDQYYYDLNIDWTGWKLVSLKYSSFKRSTNPQKGGSGNQIMQSDRISGFALSLNNSKTGVTCDTYIDCIYMTEGGPFVP